jgi:hypothetical protein
MDLCFREGIAFPAPTVLSRQASHMGKALQSFMMNAVIARS